MTLKRWLPILALPVAALVFLNWWNGDTQRIARRLKGLAETLDKGPGEGQLAAAMRSQEAASYFAEPFDFRARPFDFQTGDRQTLTRTIASYRLRSERIGVQLFDERLDVDTEARRATQQLSVKFVGGLRGLGEEAYRFQLNWVEQEGVWKIDFVDLLEILPARRGL